MAYKKRQQSSEVDKANKRIDGLMSLGPQTDLGNGLTIAAYKSKIDEVENLTQKYNTLLSEVDGCLTQLEKSEKALAEFSDRMLSGVGSKFGFDSIEYEKAGGVRKSEIRRTVKKNENASVGK